MQEDYAKALPQDQDTLLRRFIWHFLPLILSNRAIEIVLIDGTKVHLVDYVKKELQIENKPTSFSVASKTFQLNHVLLKPKS